MATEPLPPLVPRHVRTSQVERVVWEAEGHRPQGRLVLGFHGGMAAAQDLAQRSGLREALAALGQPIAFPQALLHWCDGRPPLEEGWPDDREAVEAILRSEGGAEGAEARLAVVGVSNGGMFALRLACELRPAPVAAVALAAAMPAALAASAPKGPPVPVMIVQGTDDVAIPWDGGEVLPLPGVTVEGELLGAEATVAFWLRRNRCVGAPRVRRASIGPHPVEIRVWAAGEGGAEVWRVVMRGAGHRMLDREDGADLHGSLEELVARFVTWHLDRDRLLGPRRAAPGPVPGTAAPPPR